MTTRTPRPLRRGDNIPSVSDYAHWGEDAQAMWYAENRYDMEHADEIIEEDWDGDMNGRDEPDPFEESFDTYDEALAFMDRHHLKPNCDGVNVTDWGSKWYVEHYDEKAHKAYLRKRQ